MSEWLQIVNTVGVPVAFSSVFLYATYRVGLFMGPMLRDFFAAQLSLISSLRETTQTQTTILERHTEMLTQHGQKIDEIHSATVRGASP